MKRLLGAWNKKVNVKEVGIKFQKNWKIPRDRYSSHKRILKIFCTYKHKVQLA